MIGDKNWKIHTAVDGCTSFILPVAGAPGILRLHGIPAQKALPQSISFVVLILQLYYELQNFKVSHICLSLQKWCRPGRVKRDPHDETEGKSENRRV